MFDPVSLLTGALLVVGGYSGGRVGRKRAPKEPPSRLLAPVCGCGHHKSFHGEKGCKATYGTRKLDKYGNDKGNFGHEKCGCAKYEGPVPMTEYYPTELEG